MCYTRKDWSREEEARRLRMEGKSRGRREEVRPAHEEHKEDKPLTEKVKELVGVK
jgi:hypothetical protein